MGAGGGDRREFIYAELVSTEGTYVEDLELIIYDYKQPSAEASGLGVGQSFWDTVFGNVEDIHYTSYYLFESLQVGCGDGGAVLHRLPLPIPRAIERCKQTTSHFPVNIHLFTTMDLPARRTRTGTWENALSALRHTSTPMSLTAPTTRQPASCCAMRRSGIPRSPPGSMPGRGCVHARTSNAFGEPQCCGVMLM